jgi:GWxTD domain-containing protein
LKTQGDDAMLTRTSGSVVLLALALLPPGLAAAQKLDKDDKRWLDEVRPILLADEEKTYKALKDKADRLEFQNIFWARRDPNPETPENEYRVQFQAAVAEAGRQFRLPAMSGSDSDCGRVFILLGKPDEVQKQEEEVSPGLRAPETWTYRSKPGQTIQGGKATIAFDAECRAPAGLAAQLERVAAAKVVRPNLDYRMGKDGHLVKLVDLLPKDTPARALAKQPRQDFPVAAQEVYLKVADGSTAVLGLVRGEASAFTLSESGGKKVAHVVVAASAVGEDGKEAGWTEQPATVEAAADGSVVASFKMGLKPGHYTLKAGLLDAKGGKASLASQAMDVPDFARIETGADGSVSPLPSVGSIIMVRDVEELPPGAPADPSHPFAAFELGPARLVPYFDRIAHRSERVAFFYQVYDLRVDPATGKADAVATLALLKDGKTPVAKAAANPIQTPVGGSVVGPIPLEKYEPGRYVVQVKVTDKLAKKDLVQEAPFEIQP